MEIEGNMLTRAQLNEHATRTSYDLEEVLRTSLALVVDLAHACEVSATAYDQWETMQYSRPKCRMLISEEQVRLAYGLCRDMLSTLRILIVRVCDPSICNGMSNMDTFRAHLLG